jgi:hypothetical protein
MQPISVERTETQHVDPQSDPHDDIAAILRSDSIPRTAPPDPSELHIGLADRVAAAASLPPPESALRAPPESALRSPPLDDYRALSAPAPRSRARSGFVRFVLVVCLGIAATVGVQAYGETARDVLASWAPQLVTAAPTLAQAQNASDQPAPAPVQAAAEAPAQAAQPAAAETTTAPPPAAPVQAAAPAQAAASPEIMHLIEGMSREIASLRESIEQLKTNQRQMSRELAKATEEPKQQRKQATTAAPPPPPTRPVAAPLPPQPRQQTYAPPPQQQVYIPPPPTTQQYGDPYVPRPPRALP